MADAYAAISVSSSSSGEPRTRFATRTDPTPFQSRFDSLPPFSPDLPPSLHGTLGFGLLAAAFALAFTFTTCACAICGASSAVDSRVLVQSAKEVLTPGRGVGRGDSECLSRAGSDIFVRGGRRARMRAKDTRGCQPTVVQAMSDSAHSSAQVRPRVPLILARATGHRACTIAMPFKLVQVRTSEGVVSQHGAERPRPRSTFPARAAESSSCQNAFRTATISSSR